MTSAVESELNLNFLLMDHFSLCYCYEVRRNIVTHEPFYCSQVVNPILPISANVHGDRET